MPLLKGQPYRPSEQLPSGLKRNHELWVIRTTGEVFLDYELYLQKVRLYREPVWTCIKTSRSGLTYLQAVMSENSHKTEEEETREKEPLVKPPPSLQMTLTSAVIPQHVDLDLQLIGPYLRNEARSILSAMTPEGLEGALLHENGNQSSDKKCRASGKESEQGKSKSDAKKIPGTVKHTIYETLKWVGANGASISYLHQRLKDCRIQTTWADSSARNCIASLLNHDKAFVKLPKHGHYALAVYGKEETGETDKRELSNNENDAPEYPRNNGRCMKCLKAKHPENSPLVFCDQCPSAIHAVCAEEYEIAMREASEENVTCSIQFPYLCYKCIQKRRTAERQKVVRQKREEEKQKRQEERNQRLGELDDNAKDADGRKRIFPHRPPVARYPIEDTLLTVDDHRHKEALLTGPVLPAAHPKGQELLEAVAVCEFLCIFGSELDERLAVTDVTVPELMYSLCWPFDSSLIKNTYQALLKTAVHQAVKLPDAPSDVRHWNVVMDGYTWPEILKFYLMYQEEQDLVQQIRQELEVQEGSEKKLFLEISPALHLKLLSTLVAHVASSFMLRQCADVRLAEAKRLESVITKMRREMSKSKGKNSTAAPVQAAPTDKVGKEQGACENGDGEKRHLRRRASPEESKEVIAQNELAAHEEQLERCKVRCEPMGLDRHRHEYFWFYNSFPESLCVIDSDHTTIHCVRSKEELDKIMAGLNLRGIREKHLMEVLKREYETLCVWLSAPEFSFDLENIPRGVSCVEMEPFYKANKKQSRTSVEKLRQEHVMAALKTIVNRLHKIVGSVASVDTELQDDIKNTRFRLNSLTSLSKLSEFLSGLNDVLKRVFHDGGERQSGKMQMRLTAHLESLQNGVQSSLSEMSLYIATLREIIDPLVRARSKALQAAADAKRKRLDKSTSEKSCTSSDVTGPSKKQKQRHEGSEVSHEADVLPFVAVPWRVTRSHARKGLSAARLDPCIETSASATTPSEISDSNKLDVTDDEYEVANESEDEQDSTNEEAVCRMCSFGGRLIRCSGSNCEISIHRSCMMGGKGNETEWYCSKCARTKRALYRNDKGT